MTDRAELQRLAERIAHGVWAVRLGDAPTRWEIDRLQALRRKLAVDYDAVNRTWKPWTEEAI